ncbi:hypothetical protein ACNKU7_08415 [Microbulbifer sp. SA54]|uniref:hypothetical protein n=1 Tax=Microbulbifer sp. SA54 TaxID=3401577 RepID=UPI003AAA27F0
MKKRFHISCCGRSGSKYIAQALRSMGFSVLHEMGDDWPYPKEYGIKYIAQNPRMFRNFDTIVGWKWSILTPRYSESFPIQFHMVRNPISAIESATTHSDALFNQVERHLGKPNFLSSFDDEENIRLGRAVNYWISYNQRFSAGKPILRIEDFSKEGRSLEKFCEILNLPTSIGLLLEHLPKDLNTRKMANRRVGLNWRKLHETFPQQAEKILSMGIQYGYEIQTEAV